MKRVSPLGFSKLLLFGLAFMLVMMPPLSTASAGQQEVEPIDCFRTTLWAGQHIEAGFVHVTRIGSELEIKFETTDDWYIVKTHLDVVDSEADLKVGGNHTHSNLAPGLFEYQDDVDHDPPVQEVTWMVPITWEQGTTLYIAAHCEVKKIVDGEVVQEESAWGNRKDGGAWGTYFTLTLCDYDDDNGNGDNGNGDNGNGDNGNGDNGNGDNGNGDNGNGDNGNGDNGNGDNGNGDNGNGDNGNGDNGNGDNGNGDNELPFTGGNNMLPILSGLLMLAAGLGLRRR